VLRLHRSSGKKRGAMIQRPNIMINNVILSEEEVLAVLVAMSDYEDLLGSTDTFSMGRHRFMRFQKSLKAARGINGYLEGAERKEE